MAQVVEPREQRDRPFVFSVAGIVHRMRRQLEGAYPNTYVGGEISAFQVNPSSGHAFFTLKDQRAKLSCIMWRDDLERLRFRPQRGHEVILRGSVTLFEREGRLQMRVVHIEPQGLGALQQELADRLAKLKGEGLTDPARKRPLPAHPRAIGVVTSLGGAALRDILKTLLRRDPRARVVISGARVQGRASASSVVDAIRRLDALERVDVIIVARGGGSAEELWAFNEEPVARAIVACSVPVVTGIGHEIDHTVADAVADKATSTPTAAAEHVVADRAAVARRVVEQTARLHQLLRRKIDQHGRRLASLEARLVDPTAALRRRAQHVDELAAKMNAAIARRMHAGSERLAVLVGQLESLSPLAVLSRGYALVDADGALVKRADQVAPGDRISVQLGQGRLVATVEETHEE